MSQLRIGDRLSRIERAIAQLDPRIPYVMHCIREGYARLRIDASAPQPPLAPADEFRARQLWMAAAGMSGVSEDGAARSWTQHIAGHNKRWAQHAHAMQLLSGSKDVSGSQEPMPARVSLASAAHAAGQSATEPDSPAPLPDGSTNPGD
jgi:hypothetical protein